MLIYFGQNTFKYLNADTLDDISFLKKYWDAITLDRTRLTIVTLYNSQSKVWDHNKTMEPI
jgi:hypothetical protein